MISNGSKLIGRKVEASDGGVGRVHNVVFDEITSQMRWLIVETVHPLPRRRVLLHPSVMGALDNVGGALRIKLPLACIATAPRSVQEQSMSMQIDSQISDYQD